MQFDLETRKLIPSPKVATYDLQPTMSAVEVGQAVRKIFTRFKRFRSSPASIYLLIVNNRNTRKRCEICSKLTIKTPE